jgi:DNA-binding NarL/FixJ family response regulator
MIDGEIRILLVDDHGLFREGVKRILELEPGMNIVGECGSGDEALEKVELLQPDVILMDINMPNLNGVEATNLIIKRSPSSRVIILSIHDDEQYVYRTLRCGASGYLLKEMDAESLVEAVRVVAGGGTYIHHKVTGKLINEFRRLSDEDERYREELAAANATEPEELEIWESLTPRERDVLKLMAEGNNNRSIGLKLYISEKTVKNHVSSILMKMGVDDRTQAVVQAIHNGWMKL